MDPIALALIIGLGSGVVGGMASQLVAGAFKTHGDTRQITAASEVAKAAEKRWEQEQELERQKVLADDRRQLFIKTAHALQRMRETLNQREWADENDWFNDWHDAVKTRADELFVLETEMRLLAPTITNNVRAATAIARGVRDSPYNIEKSQLEELRMEFLRLTMKAMTQMRTVLGTEPIDPSELELSEQAMLQGLI